MKFMKGIIFSALLLASGGVYASSFGLALASGGSLVLNIGSPCLSKALTDQGLSGGVHVLPSGKVEFLCWTMSLNKAVVVTFEGGEWVVYNPAKFTKLQEG